VRAVLDPNVLISALLSPAGAPARVLRTWLDGGFELVVSPDLLAELERALGYPKLRKHVSAEDARDVLDWLASTAHMARDPEDPPTVASSDPGDDYLIALAEAERAVLVSGDDHLLALADQIPVLRPAEFLARFVPEPPQG
jgi:hypothetical protein